MKIILFDSPINASNYIKDFGISNGVALRSIDYEQNLYRFSLIDQHGVVSSVVNGIVVNEAAEESVGEEVRERIALTLN